MKDSIEESIRNMNKNESPDEELYNSLLKKIDFNIDIDFLDFIKKYNGAEGNSSQNNYIIFWEIGDLIALNPYYEDIEESKTLFFFGTDGSNLGYAFDKKDASVVAIDFLEISYKEPRQVASSFELFVGVVV